MISIQIIGRATHDIELKYGQSGSAFCNFRLAGTTKRSDETAVFLNCTAFGKSAEAIAKYVHKGDRLLVLGELKDDSYEKEGKRILNYKVAVNDFELVEPKKKEEVPQPNAEGFVPDSVDDEDIPFA